MDAEWLDYFRSVATASAETARLGVLRQDPQIRHTAALWGFAEISLRYARGLGEFLPSELESDLLRLLHRHAPDGLHLPAGEPAE